MRRGRVTSGIDLPLAPSCGSMILCSDIYRSLARQLEVAFFALPPADAEWSHGFAEIMFCKSEKQPYGQDFPRYVDALTDEVGRHVGRLRPDSIHAQHLGFGLSLAFSRIRGSIPMVAIAHGTDVIAATHSPQAHSALCEVVTASTTVILPTEQLRRRVNDLTEGRFASKLVVTPWGIPLDRVRTRLRPRSGEQLHLLHAGRLDQNKDTATAVRSLTMTARDHDLTIIGDGGELAALHQLAAELGVAHRVYHLPFLPRERLWDVFARYDAFLFTTSELEAFGLVAVEAQAHGLPVVHSDIAGMAETLGWAGLAFDPGDARGLADCVDRLATNGELRAELGRRGVANAQRYDIHTTARHWEAVNHRVQGAGHV